MFLAAWEENFDKILAEFTVGDPMREGVLWTNLCRPEISRRFALMGTLAVKSARCAQTAQEEPSGPAQSLQEKVYGYAPAPHHWR